MIDPERKKAYTIVIPIPIMDKLKDLSKQTGNTRSSIIRFALSEFLGGFGCPSPTRKRGQQADMEADEDEKERHGTVQRKPFEAVDHHR